MFELLREDQELIDAIKARVLDGQRATLMAEKFGYEVTVYPPVSVEELERAELEIKFRFPALIREIYLQVGNGGFGPGYGITGLTGGYRIYEKTLVENCVQSSTLRNKLSEYFSEAELANWKWDTHYIVYCYWGCNVTSLIDCKYPSIPVYSLDSITAVEHSSGNLRQWWIDWLNGTINQY